MIPQKAYVQEAWAFNAEGRWSRSKLDYEVVLGHEHHGNNNRSVTPSAFRLGYNPWKLDGLW